MKKQNTKGITLIALVVTIVVLLILAAVSISMLVGENGIIKQTQEAKDESEQARVEELVDLAIGSLIIQYDGDTNKITPKMVADEINRTENRTDVYAERDTFPTNIIFPEEGRQAEAYLSSGTYDGIYTADGLEDKIASTEIFDYEIIDNAEIGATEWDNLPTKQAKITRIKPEYCNGYGYNPDTDDNDLTNTNYEIVLDDGSKITDTLVVPYKVDGKYIQGGAEGEWYTITEVDLSVKGDKEGCALPKVETIVYPNTVKKITAQGGIENNYSITKVILSQNLQEIGEQTFYKCTNLRDITIPSSVKTIGEYAFYECRSLSTVTILGVTNIENGAFSRCGSLSSIKLTSNVGKNAFYNCSNLSEIIIQEGVTSIGDAAFQYCESLKNIKVDSNNKVYDSRENCNAIIETATNTLLVGTASTIIPSSITSIGDYAFYYNKLLTDITIPTNVKSIGNYAFASCENLSAITVLDGVTSIGNKAFLSCSSLPNITIPSTVTSIGDWAFTYCYDLDNIVIPGGVKSLEESTFSGCDNLKNIILQEGVTTIGSSVFQGCDGLTSITIPSTVTTITGNAFVFCRNLKTINIKNTTGSISGSPWSASNAKINWNYTGE